MQQFMLTNPIPNETRPNLYSLAVELLFTAVQMA